MGLSLMSAMMIQGNETSVKTYSNNKRTGYGFIVYLMKKGKIHTKIVSTLPNFPYRNKKVAWKAGDILVEEVRKLDLSSKLKKPICSETLNTVSEIVRKANE